MMKEKKDSLRELRMRLKMTQNEAAELMKVSDRCWQYWEKGERDVPDLIFEQFEEKIMKRLNLIFQELNLKEIINEAIKTAHHSDIQYIYFSTFAKMEREEKDKYSKEVFALLAFSFYLCLKTPEDRFRPFGMVEEINPYFVKFYSSIFENVTDLILKIRLSDILWVSKKGDPDRIKYAKSVIDFSMQLPFSPKGHTSFSFTCTMLARAAYLSKFIDKYKEDVLKLFFLSKFDDLSEEYAHSFIKVIQILGNDLNQKEKDTLFKKYINYAREIKNKIDVNCRYLIAYKYYEEASRFITDDNILEEITNEKVDLLLQEATEAVIQKNYYLAIDNYKKSIEIYNDSVKNYKYNITKYQNIMDEINKKLKKSQLIVAENLRKFDKYEEVHLSEDQAKELTDIAEKSINHVRNKKFPEVLYYFSGITPLIDLNNLKKISEKNDISTLSLFPQVYYDKEGRILRKSSLASKSNINDNQALNPYELMVQNYHSNHIELIVKVTILPALYTIKNEHIITEESILNILSNSNTIPKNRAILWAKGIYSGFKDDFISSIHILIPQLEHFIRMKMEEANIITIKNQKDKAENKILLDAMLRNEKLKTLLPENLIFELKALLIEPGIGLNLRNHMCHGLLEVEEMFSAASIYVWWLCLRLAIHDHVVCSTNTDKRANPILSC